MKQSLLLLFFFSSIEIFSQQEADTINIEEIKSTLSYLASDQLKGRVNFTREQLIAGTLLGNKFKEYGLFPFPGFQYYYQPFSPYSENKMFIKNELKWNQNYLVSSSFLYLTNTLFAEKKLFKDYTLIKADSFVLPDSILLQHWSDTAPVLIWINKRFKSGDTLVYENVIMPANAPQNDILIVANPEEPLNIELSINKEFSNNVLFNIIGLQPGKSKSSEAVIFSAHYDHVDRNPSGVQNGIFNGANDNASGTVAVLALAKYFSMRKDNERTLIFCLFAGEELGVLGSQQFLQYINPKDIKAVINIEMIGVPSRTGNNSFFITGSKFSDLKEILEKNLIANKVKIRKEGFDSKKLFQRSDNYPFYLNRIPAHSIMCSDDSDICYHKQCDDAGRINFENMVLVIKAIAESCKTIISGEDTPKLR